MSTKKAKSFNHQVYQKAYKRLNLTTTQRVIFQRLLGFLIRNNKPFPFSAVSMHELTGFSLRTIFYTFNELETLRLINRIGMGKNRKFYPGSILNKIFTTVQNRSKKPLDKKLTTVQPVQQNLINRATGAYNKTSSLLKHKERGYFFDPDYHEYVKTIESDKNLGLISKNVEILKYEDWKARDIISK